MSHSTTLLFLISHCDSSAILLTPEDLVLCIWLSTNMLASLYEGIELGVGESLIQKAIGEATGKSLANIKKEYDSLGDLGLVAQVHDRIFIM